MTAGQRHNGQRAKGTAGNGPTRQKPTKQGNGHRNGPTGQRDNDLRVNGFTGQRGAADSPANGNKHKATSRATKQQHYEIERGIQSTTSNKITKSREEDDRDKRAATIIGRAEPSTQDHASTRRQYTLKESRKEERRR